VNFQPASAPTFAGYTVDAGAVYGPRGDGFTFGWNANNLNATDDRNSRKSPDQRYDTLIQMQRSSNPNAFWEVAVPSGSYSVRVVAGDPNSHFGEYKVNVENVLVIDHSPEETTRWADRTHTVTVADGRLTIANGVGAAGNKLCFVEIVRVS
jgi:hypothetical protein